MTASVPFDLGPPVLLHVCPPELHEAALAVGEVRPPSLDDIGFVHLCTRAQLPGVFGRFYQAAVGLLLLHVDPTRLPTGALLWEEGEPDEDFPHLYAPLPLAAVVRVAPLDQLGVVDVARTTTATPGTVSSG